MFFIKYIMLFLVLFVSAKSQDNYEKSSSFEGLHFYVGFIENEFYVIDPTRNKELKIFVSTKKASNIEIKFPNQNSQFFSLPADSVMVMEVPPNVESDESEKITERLVEIKSDVPVTVYAFSSQPRTSDSYSAIPIANWGREYYVMSFPNDQYSLDKPPAHKQDSIRLLTPRTSEFMVISAYDGTKVEITPKALTQGAMQVDTTYEITLNKGECYMVQSYPLPAHRGDLSGTKIESSKPIGVISGHQRASVPIGLNPQFDTKDHLVEMITPAESWGKSYISVPFNIAPDGDLFRVMGKEQGTIISRQTSAGEIQYNLNDERFMYEFRGIDEPALWNANKPVQIAQFMMRTNNEDRNDLYDPSMVMLSPSEQFVSRVIFHTPGNVFNNPEQYIEHYVTVIAEKEALPHISLNGKLLDTTTVISNNRIASSDFYWTQIKLPGGTHKLKSKKGKFSGILFGNGKYDSYAMILGASLTNPEYEDSLAPVVNYDVDCYEMNAVATDDDNISASGIYYIFVKENETENFSWEIDPINPNDSLITFTATPEDIFSDGTFVAEIYDKSGNLRKFEYEHNAVALDVPDDFEYSDIDWQDSVCFDYSVTNFGSEEIELVDIVISSDSRVLLNGTDNLPQFISGNDSFDFQICINPDGDSTLISGDIEFVFECGITRSFPLVVGFSAPALITENLDFGDVLVGQDSCMNLKIINIGNEAITIESLDESGDAAQFTYDSSVLPYTINKSDSLVIEVCFNPSEIGDFELIFNYINDFNLVKQSVLKGRGIAPDVDNVSIDLGKIRVGDTKDSTLNLLNTGNADVKLFFDGFINEDEDDDISRMLEGIDDISIEQNEEYTENFSFTPQSSGNYSQIAEYKTNWDNHNDITVEISALGTIPEIDITDVDFDEVTVYTDTTGIFTIINSTGNEALYIQDASIISGNTDYFEIDLEQFSGIIIDEGDVFNVPVRFNPQEIGDFELIIGINNDSYPDYNIETDTLVISGKSVPLLHPELLFTESYEEFSYCQYGQNLINIQNQEEVSVDITDIILESREAYSYYYDELPAFPIKLKAGESFDIRVNSIAELPETIRYSLIIETFETNLDTFDVLIEPLEKPVILDDIADITVIPGDTIDVTFSGRFPDYTHIGGEYEFHINVPSNYWHLIGNEYSMDVDLLHTENWLLNATQEYDKIILKGRNSPISQAADFEFTLKILPLLEKSEKINISVNAYYNKCYANASEDFVSIIDGVCAFDLRITEINSNFTNLKISPNPVSDILKFELFVKENQKINISLFDMSGRNIKLGEGVDVKTGKNNFEYQTDDISNGIYVLSVTNENMNKNLIIVVNK